MNLLWPHIERIASLLEDDERQSVLGDIQERGASFRALIDLTGLVILRQLQAWTSWKTWVLAVSLYLPARIAAIQTQPIAHLLYAGWTEFRIDPWGVFGAPILAWAVGFTLARFGRRRAASFLFLLPAVFAWDIYQVARFTFVPANMTVLAYPTLFGTARLAFLESEALVAAMLLMLVAVVVPCLRGYSRGLNTRPLSIGFTLLFALSSTPFLWMAIRHIGAFGRLSVFELPLVAVVLWPVIYMLATSRRTPNRVIHNV